MDVQTIGERIRDTREDKNISQKQLAYEIGIGASDMSKIEYGNRQINSKELVDISKALDVRVDYLLGIDSDIDEKTHFIHSFLQTFDKITTAEKSNSIDDGVYTPEDLTFSMKEDYVILTGEKSFFSLIEEIAKGENQYLTSAEYRKLIQRGVQALPKDGAKDSDREIERYFLVSQKQMDAIRMQLPRLRFRVENALQVISEDPSEE